MFEFSFLTILAGITTGEFKREDKAGQKFTRLVLRDANGVRQSLPWWEAPLPEGEALVLGEGDEARFAAGDAVRVTLRLNRAGSASVARIAHAEVAVPTASLVG
jgi:hypothetical protein